MPPLPGPILETRGLTMLMRGILRMTVRVLRTLRQAEGDGRPLSLLRPLSPRLAAKRAARGGTWVRGHVRKPRWSRSRKLELSEIAIAAADIWAQLGIRPPFEDNTRIGSLSSASLVSGTNCIGWCYCHDPRNCGCTAPCAASGLRARSSTLPRQATTRSACRSGRSTPRRGETCFVGTGVISCSAWQKHRGREHTGGCTTDMTS